jgi:hypothetical protein
MDQWFRDAITEVSAACQILLKNGMRQVDICIEDKMSGYERSVKVSAQRVDPQEGNDESL